MSGHSKFLCNCLCVTKSEVVNAVRKRGAETLTDIQNLTHASTGCRRCLPLVSEILNKELEKKRIEGLQLKIDFDR